MENFWVYILYSNTINRFYTGQTNNIKSRLKRHNEGTVPSTKNGKPWSLVHTEKIETRSEALILEKKIKKRGAKRYLQDLGL